jgi:WD40 repeat protein
VPDHASSEESSGLVPTGQPHAHGRPQVPNHQLLRCVGHGAFGEVWLARNIMGTYRAVKVVYRQNFTDERPYQREFRGLQKFEPISRSHDGFIDILDTGLNAAEGYFYYVMEVADDVVSGSKIEPDLYEARTLDKEAVRGRCVPVQTCVSLGVSLSAALSHLHKHGLLHRDIKPSNIIFVNGIPKIADIGLVAQVEGTQTFGGGTPGYYPPNEGPGTVQADIYALGKVLYELTTGQDRFDYPDLPIHLDEMQDPDQFRELNQVILKACEEDPHKRYAKAQDLHADLLLLMAGKSVRRIRALEKRVAWLIQVGSAMALLLLVAGAGFYGWNRHLRRLAEQRQEQVGRNVAHGNTLVDSGDFFGALPFFCEALRLEQEVPLGEKNNRLRIATLLEQCPKLIGKCVLDGQHLNAADLTPDGGHVITAATDGTATLYDVARGLKSQPWPKDKEIEAVSFSPQGTYVAMAGDGFVKVWEMATHTLVSTVNPTDTVYCVKFTPDETQFITASGSDPEGHVYLYDTRNPGKGVELARGADVYRMAAFSPDGTRFVTACQNGIAQVWDFTRKRPIGEPIIHSSWVYCASFSPDGRLVVTASADGTAQVCEAETGKRILQLRHPQLVKSAGFSPDGRYIVTASWDYTARIWDASTGELIYPILRQSGKFLRYVSFFPDGRRVLIVNFDGDICLWDLAIPMRRSPTEGYFLASQDGNRLCSFQGDHLDVFDPTNHASASRIVADGVRNVTLNKDGSRLITLSESTQSMNSVTVAQLWNTTTATALSPPFMVDSAPTNASLNDDGGRLVTWKGKQATVWDTFVGRRLYSIDHADKVADPDESGSDKGPCFSPDGAWLATIAATNVYVWNAGKGTFRCVLPHPDLVEHIAFSSDSHLLVSCCGSPGTLFERTAQLWDVSSGHCVGPPLHHADGVVYAEFNRDGSRVVTASEDGTARVWEVPTARQLLVLDNRFGVTEARFSSDGSRIVTACEHNSTARVWDAQTGEPLTPPLKHPWKLTRAQFVGDGREILSRRASKKERESMLWELPNETMRFEELTELAKVLSGQRTDARGAMVLQTVSEDEVINWHLREAEASEKAKQWSAAVFHWNYIVELKPDDQMFRDRLNRARDLARTNTLPKL